MEWWKELFGRWFQEETILAARWTSSGELRVTTSHGSYTGRRDSWRDGLVPGKRPPRRVAKQLVAIYELERSRQRKKLNEKRQL